MSECGKNHHKTGKYPIFTQKVSSRNLQNNHLNGQFTRTKNATNSLKTKVHAKQGQLKFKADVQKSSQKWHEKQRKTMRVLRWAEN